MVIGYFDESGHSDDTGYVAIAAFAGEPQMWSALQDRWQSALNQCDAPFLHMREFAHSVGPYKGWYEGRRRELLGACVQAINDSGLTAIASAVSVSTFRSLTPDVQEKFVDPFFVCAQEVIRGVGIRADHEPDGVKCRMVFSRQDELQSMILKLWDGLRDFSDVNLRMGDLEFEDMRASPGLQAADLLAYEMRHFYQRRASHPAAPPRWPFRTIVRHQYNTLGARMLKFLPQWYLDLQASEEFETGMSALLRDPVRFNQVLKELHPQVE